MKYFRIWAMIFQVVIAVQEVHNKVTLEIELT